MDIKSLISSNLDQIKAKIADACRRSGRDPAEVKLVAASKKQPVEKMNALQEICAARGERAIFGENYVQDFKKKKELLTAGYSAHLIGPLQSNKVRDAVSIFDLIESVHSLEMAGLINRAALRAGKVQSIFLQVNISDDPDKSGFKRDALFEFIKGELPDLKGLELKGLMTITRLYDDPGEARPDFRAMRELRDRIIAEQAFHQVCHSGSLEISMGMSDDYWIAVEEGATLVRIGTALFGERA